MASTRAWSDLPVQLQSALLKLPSLFATDSQFQAFANTLENEDHFTFGVKSAGADKTWAIILIRVSKSKTLASIGSYEDALFTLSALPQQWEEFFKAVPLAPYQSYWGLLGLNNKQKGVEILGDEMAFWKFAPFWRRALELLHDAHCGPIKAEEEPETEEDHIVGRYIYANVPIWGRSKIFYEQSGTGNQDIVFLHTAGADSRQYHGVMNNPEMRRKCNMIAFDLPGHGRSFPTEKLPPGTHTTTEDSYVGAITAMVKALKPNKPIICGASMAGQVCLAVAIRADEVGAGGTIPLQGCDYLHMERQSHDRSPNINQSLFNAELAYGMMSPTAPLKNRQLIWHLYSSQAYGIFHGDLDFYFGGWDGRSRVGNIDTKKCPVYMLTGEYDWSNTPAMAQATCEKIPGAKHKTMLQLGHFPATENPGRFVPYLVEAIEHIQGTRE
ncbi:hypothetical protein LSUE1_G005326 [Lachnellula suecica]|uniref:AB hydrolase-1 domain-containing protein n=1 Tax=Lachnellula suecica TaxID=602035 RepID=A0A8T9C1W2_9HELO|nr:hypothetical protein LSUE1_G005326 [Lachnellula suecica]